MRRLLLILAVALAACSGGAVADTAAPTTTPPTTTSTTTTTAPPTTTTAPPTTTTVVRDPIRILALGDSYTIGQSVDEDERWPVRLARALEESGWSTVDVEIIARTGWTTAELDRGIDAADPQGPFDLVTILIGVNDQFRGRSADAYGEELAAMIERAQGFSTGPVLMVSIPDWGTTPYGEGYSPKVIARDIDEYNAVGTEVSAAAGIPFVDITPISRSGDPDLVSYDDLHPSGSQYAAWVEEILPVAIDLLEG